MVGVLPWISIKSYKKVGCFPLFNEASNNWKGKYTILTVTNDITQRIQKPWKASLNFDIIL